MGGSLAVRPNRDSKAGIVACAPRWGNRYSVNDTFMLGMCYVIPKDLTPSNIIKLPALVSGNNYMYKYPDNKTIHNWAMAGYGINAHYTSEETSLLFGAPGLKDWTGGFVNVNLATRLSATVSESDPYLVNETSSSLAGFAITSGFYSNHSSRHEYFVVGIPRAKLTGQVKIFMSEQISYSLQNPWLDINAIDHKAEDLPINSYFGGSLLTADVNADGIDDLLVGAPLYSPDSRKESVDLGAVFLYLGPLNDSSVIVPKLTLKGTGTGGRFGTSMAYLTDMNNDGFNDVAIGAPFEDDLRGAVYIYNGYKGGLWPAYSQRILASTLPNGQTLRGLGVSIARAVDLNADNVPDTIVGSHLSDQVVVLYGQPVIKMSADLEITPDRFIEKNSDNVEIRACFRFSHAICEKIFVDVKFKLDTKKETGRERVVFNQTRIPSAIKSVTVFQGMSSCTDRLRLFAKSPTDMVREINIEAEYEIGENGIRCDTKLNPTIERFNGLNPGDPDLVLETKIEFKKACPNNICKTDLHVRASASFDNSSGFLIIGKSEISLNIKITKTGDPSYGSVFYMIYPNFLSFIRIKELTNNTVSCSPLVAPSQTAHQAAIPDEWIEFRRRTNATLKVTDSVLMCNFGNPLSDDSGTAVDVELVLPDHVTTELFYIVVMATTLSNEMNSFDNNETIAIRLKHVYATKLSGAASLETIFINDNKIHDEVNHTFALDNLGPSLIPYAILNVFFPITQHGSGALLWVNRTTVRCRTPCNVECEFRSKFRIPDITMDINGRHSNFTSGDKPNETLTVTTQLNCNAADCTQLTCRATNIQPKSNLVVMAQIIVMHDFGGISKDRSTIEVVSAATTNTTGLEDKGILKEQIVTRVVPRQIFKKEVPWWVVLLSILGGIIFIAVLVFILFKFGFFKRKTREDLEKMRLLKEKNGKSPSPPSEGTGSPYELKNGSGEFTDSEQLPVKEKNETLI
ncbi:integrin alpha-PS3-like [Dreissena polymorpha]|uniref:integrin alpha-PS3-like n=1 Tax=Dreissena polymorpha TaxID=45954 RepID=UPI002264EFA1|nr:integrin alpha-PS3-like [Dreissena polymorpha]